MHRITAEDIDRLRRKQGNKCVYCPADLSERYTIDHKTPTRRGGSTSIRNLQVVCRSCNSKKGAMTVREYKKFRATGVLPTSYIIHRAVSGRR